MTPDISVLALSFNKAGSSAELFLVPFLHMLRQASLSTSRWYSYKLVIGIFVLPAVRCHGSVLWPLVVMDAGRVLPSVMCPGIRVLSLYIRTCLAHVSASFVVGFVGGYSLVFPRLLPSLARKLTSEDPTQLSGEERTLDG